MVSQPQSKPQNEKVRPVDTAIQLCEGIIHRLNMAKTATYPPAAAAHLWSAVNDLSRLGFAIDREIQSLNSAWARHTPAHRVEDVPVAEAGTLTPTAVRDADPGI